MKQTHDIISDFYDPLLKAHGFIAEYENNEYGKMGMCWRLSPEIGHGTYWVYGQKDLFDIKIHNFSFHKDYLLKFIFPKCLSITKYDSISGEELSPYHRLSSGCIKSFIGGYEPYQVLIHKNIRIYSIGIEIMPSYYEDYLKHQYPKEDTNLLEAFRMVGQTEDFPEMSHLLTQVKNYRGEGLSARLFYEGKVAEAISLTVERLKKSKKDLEQVPKLSSCDISHIQTVSSYISENYASEHSLKHLAEIACMGTTKLKSVFRQVNHCTITEYIQQCRIKQAKYLLITTHLTIGQIAKTVGYSNASRLAELFRRNTGLLPGQYRKLMQQEYPPDPCMEFS